MALPLASHLDAQGVCQIVNLAQPVNAQDAATKKYVDDAVVAGTGGTPLPTPSTIMSRDAAGRSQVVDPSAAQDIATKGYVDGLKRVVSVGVVRASASLTLSASAQDVAGATTGSLTLTAGDVVILDGVFDVQNISSSFVGTLDINGTEQAGQAVLANGMTRAGISQFWSYTVPSSGSYTFKIRGRVLGTVAGTVGAPNSALKYTIYR